MAWESGWTGSSTGGMGMCMGNPESQMCPGLHQKQGDQLGMGGDSAPLLHSHKTPHRVLCPTLGHQHKKDMDLLEKVQRSP